MISEDMIGRIFAFAPVAGLSGASSVSSTWRAASTMEATWHSFALSVLPHLARDGWMPCRGWRKLMQDIVESKCSCCGSPADVHPAQLVATQKHESVANRLETILRLRKVACDQRSYRSVASLAAATANEPAFHCPFVHTSRPTALRALLVLPDCCNSVATTVACKAELEAVAGAPVVSCIEPWGISIVKGMHVQYTSTLGDTSGWSCTLLLSDPDDMAIFRLSAIPQTSQDSSFGESGMSGDSLHVTFILGTWCELIVENSSVADIYPIDRRTGERIVGAADLQRMTSSPESLCSMMCDRLEQLRFASRRAHSVEHIDSMRAHVEQNCQSFHAALVTACGAVAPELLYQ